MLTITYCLFLSCAHDQNKGIKEKNTKVSKGKHAENLHELGQFFELMLLNLIIKFLPTKKAPRLVLVNVIPLPAQRRTF